MKATGTPLRLAQKKMSNTGTSKAMTSQVTTNLATTPKTTAEEAEVEEIEMVAEVGPVVDLPMMAGETVTVGMAETIGTTGTGHQGDGAEIVQRARMERRGTDVIEIDADQGPGLAQGPRTGGPQGTIVVPLHQGLLPDVMRNAMIELTNVGVVIDTMMTIDTIAEGLIEDHATTADVTGAKGTRKEGIGIETEEETVVSARRTNRKTASKKSQTMGQSIAIARRTRG